MMQAKILHQERDFRKMLREHFEAEETRSMEAKNSCTG